MFKVDLRHNKDLIIKGGFYMKKIRMISFLLVVCSLFTSCGTDNSKKNENENKVSIMEMKKYNKTFDNVIFDTEIIVDKKEKERPFVATTATLQKYDSKKIFATFFSGIKVKEKRGVDTGTNSKENEEKDITYIGDKDERLALTEGSSSFTFENKLDKYIYNCFCMMEGDPAYNANKYSLEKEFSFASREKAMKDIKEKLLTVGIDIGDNCDYKAYALDYKTMKSEEYAMGMDGKEDKSLYKQSWSEADNCYYFVIRQKYDGIPEHHMRYDVEIKMEDDTAPIQVLYSKNGIEKIDCERIFKFNNEEKEISLISFDKIAESIVNTFGNILGDLSYKVTKAELYYMIETKGTKGTYPVTPVWIINVDQINSNKEVEKKHQIIIDAITGKEIQ